MNLLVCLVSDQTLHNVQFIKEFYRKGDNVLFVSTKAMEDNGVRNWIENACDLSGCTIVKEVNEFSAGDIENKLFSIDYDIYEKIFVNVTGGTKMMSLSCHDFFKNIAADIFYLTGGKKSKLLHLFPKRKETEKELSTEINLDVYLRAYGFEYVKSEPSGISLEYARNIFSFYSNEGLFDQYHDSILFLHSFRGKNMEGADFEKTTPLLEAMKYKPQSENALNKVETKYLTGEWFEEYVGLTIKKELKLSDDNIMIGTVIKKSMAVRHLNDASRLLGIDAEKAQSKPNNEIDVMFLYNNSLYTIECKSSIIAFKKIEKKQKDGTYNFVDKAYSILPETIYKADSIKNRFGLFAQTSIVTLTKLKTHGSDPNRLGDTIQQINRANISKIKLVDGDMLLSSEKLSDIIIH